MKKTLIGLLALVMVGSFVALAQADNPETVIVRVTITTVLGIELVSGATIDFETMAAGAVASIDDTPTVIRNDGTGANQTYKMYANSPGVWAAGSSTAHNTYVLQALFNGSLPTSGNFGSEDTLGEDVGGEITADNSTVLTIDGSYNGANVAYDENRSIYYQFQPPATSSLTGQQDITVTITAVTP